MWTDWLMVAVIGGIVALDTTAAWQVMICRPVVSGPLIGLLLGDPGTGLLIGSLLELVWAGFVPAGASVFPDSNVAAVVATSLAICLQEEAGPQPIPVVVAILYSVPVAWLGSRTIVWMRKKNAHLLGAALRHAANGDGRGIIRQNYRGLLRSWGRGFLLSGAMLAAGLIILRAGGLAIPPIHGDIGDLVRLPLAGLGAAVLLTIFASRRTLLCVALGLVAGLLWSVL